MCFIECDDPAELWIERIIVIDEQHKCGSCGRAINAGEQVAHVDWIYEGDPGQHWICNQCVQDRVSIFRWEQSAGCGKWESWAPWHDVASLIRNGQEDEDPMEFEDDDEAWQYGYVLFWPYGAPPAVRPVDLAVIPELIDSLVCCDDRDEDY